MKRQALRSAERALSNLNPVRKQLDRLEQLFDGVIDRKGDSPYSGADGVRVANNEFRVLSEQLSLEVVYLSELLFRVEAEEAEKPKKFGINSDGYEICREHGTK